MQSDRASIAEGLRIALARKLLLSSPIARLGLWITPDNHPYKKFAESTREDFINFTEAVLVPRSGAPLTIPHKLITLTYALSAWMTLDLLSRHVPGPLGPLTNVDETIRIFDRIQSAANGFIQVGMGA